MTGKNKEEVPSEQSKKRKIGDTDAPEVGCEDLDQHSDTSNVDGTKTNDKRSVGSLDEEELQEEELERKRAYNRANAARARKRTKENIASLIARVEKASSRVEELEQQNAKLTEHIAALMGENERLKEIVQLQRGAMSHETVMVPEAADVLGRRAIAPSSLETQNLLLGRLARANNLNLLSPHLLNTREAQLPGGNFAGPAQVLDASSLLASHHGLRIAGQPAFLVSGPSSYLGAGNIWQRSVSGAHTFSPSAMGATDRTGENDPRRSRLLSELNEAKAAGPRK